MATRVKIVDGRSLTHVRRKIHDMKTRAQDMRPAWGALLDWWTHGNMQHFGTQGARWRTPWRELSPVYLAAKRGDGWMGDILVRTSDLRRSLTDRPLPIELMTAHEVTAGTDVSYASFHQKGTRKMPPRKLVNARQVREEGAATSAVANWIMRGESKVTALEVKR